jgi:hypothetical protein
VPPKGLASIKSSESAGVPFGAPAPDKEVKGTVSGRARSNAVVGCLQAGDILIKYNDGSAVNNIISFGQFFGKGPAKYTHAGITSSPTTIIEMDGHGLQEHNLLTDDALITYDAFRCTLPEIAAGACEAARMMLEGFRSQTDNKPNMGITYSVSGALCSISKNQFFQDSDVANRVLDKLLASGDTFFCSGHVVLCYQMACSQGMAQSHFPIQDSGALFGLESNCYQPAYLWQILSSSQFFNKIGTVRAGQKVA